MREEKGARKRADPIGKASGNLEKALETMSRRLLTQIKEGETPGKELGELAKVMKQAVEIRQELQGEGAGQERGVRVVFAGQLRMDAPNEKQRRFLLDRHRHIAYGGARGGGKSWAVRTKAKLLALRYAGIKLLIVRRTLRELQNNHIDPLRQELAGVAKYKAADKRFEFPNGSVLTFGYCACDGDLGQYQGAEYDVVFLDEAGQLQKAWIDAINACVRGTNGFPKRTYYTLNPGGPSHGYFKRLFIDRRFEPGEREDAYSFVQALVTDNRVLLERQPDYLQQLETLPP